MDTLTVEVQQDHIDRLSKAKPISGVAELIWNGFDADAKEVSVVLTRNDLDAIESIEVRDNGIGMTYEDAKRGFRGLGGSWKQYEQLTKNERRLVHGRQGQGRFRAFAVANNIEWRSVYSTNGGSKAVVIRETSVDKRTFHLSDETAIEGESAGTLVKLSNIVTQQATLDGEKAVNELTRLFALYLKQYPKILLSYDGTRVDPVSLQDHVAEYDMGSFITEDGRTFPVHLTVVEWRLQLDRALYLCDENGFTLRETSPGVQTPGYAFTAYLRSSLLAEMADVGTIDLEEFADLKKLLDQAKEKLRKHFHQRSAEKAASVVEQWKEEKIYPYEGDPASIIEETERQVFDVVAVSVDSYLPDFKTEKPKSRKLTFSLLRYAIQSNPSALKRILEEVLGLPKEKQEEFAELLQRTSLTAMINAAKIVADRLEFISGLDYLLYDPSTKPVFKERKQLHRLIARNTWIFGDEFFLVNDDEALINVLRQHIKGFSASTDLSEPVLCGDESDEDGVVDIVLGKELPRGPNEMKHKLVIELKRPSQKIDMDVISQVKKYAFAIEKDARFSAVPTQWTFWAVSNDMSADARIESMQDGRAPGVVFTRSSMTGAMTIWTKTWAQIIEQCRGRLQFFQQQLQYSASHSSGLQYLRTTYKKFIPTVPESTG